MTLLHFCPEKFSNEKCSAQLQRRCFPQKTTTKINIFTKKILTKDVVPAEKQINQADTVNKHSRRTILPFFPPPTHQSQLGDLLACTPIYLIHLHGSLTPHILHIHIVLVKDYNKKFTFFQYISAFHQF